MTSNSPYKKVLIGFAVGLGLAIAMSPRARDRIKKLILEKSTDILPTIKEEIEQYVDRVSEAIALGKAASQQKEDELEQILLRESHKTG